MKRLAVMTFATVASLVGSLAGCQGGTGVSDQALEGPEPGKCGKIEMHVFGLHDAIGGEAYVQIERPGEHVVVVSAHDTTTWHITTGPGASLVHVYAVGVGTQTVDLSGATGNPDVKSDSKNTTGVEACGYTWPYDGKGCNTRDLLKLAAVRTGHDANSFDGCFNGSTFILDDHMHAVSECTTTFDGPIPANHFIADCDGGNEGHCGHGSDTGSGGSDTSGDGGPVFY